MKFSIYFILFSFVLLIYMMWPGPSSISNFSPLPVSEKSTLSGDTWQVPNVAGYFSNNYRGFVVPFYSNAYQRLSNFIFPPIEINYPPEFAFTAIKQYTDSTYLEELVYPLRDPLYVNGYEPFYQDGQPKFWGSTRFAPTQKEWETKVTLRFYPSPFWVKLLVWLGVSVSLGALWKMTRKVII